jgi:lipoprotein-anchoring transpeptidase ErfK/SrfK
MFTVRVLLAALATIAMTQTAFAQEQQPADMTASELSQYSQSLEDVLSTDELATEFGVPAESFQLFTYSDRLTIIVDKSLQGTTPTAQTMQVFLDGHLIKNFWISTGRQKQEITKSGASSYTSTPEGEFRNQWRDKNHVSSKWLAPMPYAQFFVGGIAIHATVPAHYKELGTRASGGCVRMHLDAAKEMWALVDEVGVTNVLIKVIDVAKHPEYSLPSAGTPVISN